MRRLHRQNWLKWVKGLVIASMLLAGVSSLAGGRALAAGEFDDLRAKWKEMLTGGTAYNASDPDIAAKIDVIESDAQALWNTMNKTAGRTSLWSGLGGSTTHIKETYRRLTKMALGYAVNDYIRYSVNVAAPGTYRIEARMKKYNDRGQFRLYIDGVPQGSVQDQYSSSETYATVDLGVVNVLLAGSKVFELRVAGSSGSGYNLAFDHVKLQPE
jgi:hypothetical protein